MQKKQIIMQGQIPHTLAERIVCDENVLTGKPVIRGTRLAVEFIIDLLALGWTEVEILENYPHIEPEDIRACVLFDLDVSKSGQIRKRIDKIPFVLLFYLPTNHQTTSIQTPGTNPGYSPSLNAG